MSIEMIIVLVIAVCNALTMTSIGFSVLLQSIHNFDLPKITEKSDTCVTKRH